VGKIVPFACSEQVDLLGTLVDNLTLAETADLICDMVDQGAPYSYVVTPNVDHIMRLRRVAEFRDAYRQAALAVPDGVPLLWASRFLGRPLKGRVNGTDLFELLAARAAAKGYRVFLLGGNPGTAERSAQVLKSRHPDLGVAGTFCPPFGFEKDEGQITGIQARVRDAGADILLVGLGSPKQEMWMHRHGGGCGVAVAIGVGISFSLVGGEIARAPAWMQSSGLEWLWRLAMEPRRLWKRYLVDDLPFFWLVLRERCRRGIWQWRG
jgi:N-acetylglucosaminyldiphosphoundecaprenol N-acetyl-beta-D-mannosaminyltransferase